MLKPILLTPTLASLTLGSATAQTVDTTTIQSFTHWELVVLSDESVAHALTWVGANEAVARADAAVQLVVEHRPTDESCSADISMMIAALPEQLEIIELQIDGGELYQLQPSSSTNGAAASALELLPDDIEVVLAAFRAGTTAVVTIGAYDAPIERYSLSLLGFTASTNAAAAQCETIRVRTERASG
jgi:hypothetical protein